MTWLILLAWPVGWITVGYLYAEDLNKLDLVEIVPSCFVIFLAGPTFIPLLFIKLGKRIGGKR